MPNREESQKRPYAPSHAGDGKGGQVYYQGATGHMLRIEKNILYVLSIFLEIILAAALSNACCSASGRSSLK